MNVVEQVRGAEIFLCRVEVVRWDRLAQLRLWYSNYHYFARSRTPKITTVLKLALARMLKRF